MPHFWSCCEGDVGLNVPLGSSVFEKGHIRKNPPSAA